VPRRRTPSPRLIRPLQDFLQAESAGGIALLAATAVALVWSNSPWRGAYHTLWSTELSLGVGRHQLALSAHDWVNDGLMTLFFFVVGLEIKRELVQGELRERRHAALPAIAALGGMVVPALLYVAVNAGSGTTHGWGIPMATDIAMAVGVLALVGRHLDPGVKLFLLALAIVDDIGAILVIALFYASGTNIAALAVAVGLVGVVVGLRAAGVQSTGPYVVVGVVLWWFTYRSGVHATIAGVVLGLLAPTQPFRPGSEQDPDALADVSSVEAAQQTARLARRAVSVVEWLEHRLHGWTSFVVVPLFALANAGIPLSRGALADAKSSTVTIGVVVGLVIGKPLGISLFAWLACRAGVAELPSGGNWSAMIGVATIGGIGFTVSIFVTGLAFTDTALIDDAKVGVLVASLVAALVGTILVRRVRPARTEG
jgi:NhaA family Na+:H+ antiporter